MSITRFDPNTIFLGGSKTDQSDLAASEAITPGHLVEKFNNAGVIRWRKNTNTTADKASQCAVAMDHPMANKGVDDAYAAGDLVEVGVGHKGSQWWMLIASGQNIAAGDPLESAGNGTLRAFSTGPVLFYADENKANVTVQTRIRVTVA